MPIAYQTKAKAEKAGVILSEDNKDVAKVWGGTDFPPGTILAHHPKHNLHAFGANAAGALEQVSALIRIKGHDDSRIVVRDEDDPFMVAIFNHDRTRTPYRGFAVPTDALDEILKLDQAKKPWLGTKVPDDGREAFKQGFMAGDNPWPEPENEEDEDGESWRSWDEAFDAAADEDAEAEEDTGGSVVKMVYRQRYREAGHPNHCGDWLAVTLNNLILGKTQTDIENFEELCNLNGVSLAKYRHGGKGWQGRLRMTGRNLLAGVVYTAGKLLVTKALRGNGIPAELPAPADWLGSQKFKNKKRAEVLEAGRSAKDQIAAIKKSKRKN